MEPEVCELCSPEVSNHVEIYKRIGEIAREKEDFFGARWSQRNVNYSIRYAVFEEFGDSGIKFLEKYQHHEEFHARDPREERNAIMQVADRLDREMPMSEMTEEQLNGLGREIDAAMGNDPGMIFQFAQALLGEEAVRFHRLNFADETLGLSLDEIRNNVQVMEKLEEEMNQTDEVPVEPPKVLLDAIEKVRNENQKKILFFGGVVIIDKKFPGFKRKVLKPQRNAGKMARRRIKFLSMTKKQQEELLKN